MRRIVNLAKDGYIVILSTHNPDHAFLYANRVLMIQGGKVIADGPPEDVMTADLIQDVYGVSVCIEDYENVNRTHKICIPRDE